MDELPKAITSGLKMNSFCLTALYYIALKSDESVFGGKTQTGKGFQQKQFLEDFRAKLARRG